MSNPIASTDDVALLLKRDLTSAEEDLTEVLLDSVVATLELHLNRWLWQREVTGERRRTGQLGRVVLNHQPVAWIDAFHNTSTSASVAFDPARDWEEAGSFTRNTLVWVDYTAGDPFPDVPWASALTDVVANAVARVVGAPTQVATGIISSYSVEGTSISYGSSLSGGGDTKGRLAVGDLGVLSRLRIPVMV